MCNVFDEFHRKIVKVNEKHRATLYLSHRKKPLILLDPYDTEDAANNFEFMATTDARSKTFN